MGFSEIFWTGFVTTSSAIVLACLGACYKSKCSRISLCCGLITLKRDVSIELQEDKKQMDNDIEKAYNLREEGHHNINAPNVDAASI